jgi:hypothetical protein
MNKKPINVYWSPAFVVERGEDLNFFYPNPKTLFSELMDQRNKNLSSTGASYLQCPAVTSKFKKMLVIKNNTNSSYKYASLGEHMAVTPDHENCLGIEFMRDSSVNFGPTVNFSIQYLFFSDEPLSMSLTPPMFHEPKYTKYGSVMPGEFDIGQWFRPLNFEVQMWKQHGEFHLEPYEPIMYLEFKTTRPILLHRFNVNERLFAYQRSADKALSIYGRYQSLVEKYNKFNNFGYRERILTEIKKNLIDEEPYKF